jgi:hypothetical protein
MPHPNGLESIESNALTAMQMVNACFEDLDRWKIIPASDAFPAPAPSLPAGALKAQVADDDAGALALSDGADYVEFCRATIIELDATGGDETFTLPDPADPATAGFPGTRWTFKRMDGSANVAKVEVDDTGAHDIEGDTERELPSQHSFLVLTHDGDAEWFVLGEG